MKITRTALSVGASVAGVLAVGGVVAGLALASGHGDSPRRRGPAAVQPSETASGAAVSSTTRAAVPANCNCQATDGATVAPPSSAVSTQSAQSAGTVSPGPSDTPTHHHLRVPPGGPSGYPSLPPLSPPRARQPHMSQHPRGPVPSASS